MDIKSYLNQAYVLSIQVEKNKARLRSALEKATDISSKVGDDKVQTSSIDKSTMSLMAELAVDLEKEISIQEQQLFDARKEIEQAIDSINDSETRLVLKLRYLYFFSWDSISVQLYLSESTVFRLHRKGLEKLTVRDSQKSS